MKNINSNNIKEDIKRIYKQLHINNKKAKENLKYYINNDTLHIYNGYIYNVNTINSVDINKKEF